MFVFTNYWRSHESLIPRKKTIDRRQSGVVYKFSAVVWHTCLKDIIIAQLTFCTVSIGMELTIKILNKGGHVPCEAPIVSGIRIVIEHV